MYAAGLDRAVFPTRGAGSNLSPVAFPNCLIPEVYVELPPECVSL
jgi:hypothetical protein